MHGEPTFFEIGVPDPVRAQTFFGRLFDWQFPPTGEPGQVSIGTPTGRGGLHGRDPSKSITMFFAVDDIEASVGLVRELGGTAEDARPEEPGFGRFALCSDDQGVPFGLHQVGG